MRQREVADALGITVQAYQNFESGRRDIKGATLKQLKELFDCTVDDLLGHVQVIEPLPSDTSEHRLISNYRDLNDVAQGKLIGYSEGLLTVPSNKKAKSDSDRD